MQSDILTQAEIDKLLETLKSGDDKQDKSSLMSDLQLGGYQDEHEDYKEEIMSNLFKEEMENRPNYSLFPSINDKNDDNILPYLKRFSFINLFILFQRELCLKQETLYLCINSA